MQKFFCDKNGNYIGSFDVPDKVEYDEEGNEISREVFKPTKGAVEAVSPPLDARQIYNKDTKKWGAVPPPTETKEDKLFASLKVVAPLVFTDAKIAEIKGG